jgi:hypothetical protein
MAISVSLLQERRRSVDLTLDVSIACECLLTRCISHSVRSVCYPRWNASVLFGTSSRSILSTRCHHVLEEDLSTLSRHRLGSDNHRFLHGLLLQCGHLMGSLLHIRLVSQVSPLERMQYVPSLLGQIYRETKDFFRSQLEYGCVLER